MALEGSRATPNLHEKGKNLPLESTGGLSAILVEESTESTSPPVHRGVHQSTESTESTGSPPGGWWTLHPSVRESTPSSQAHVFFRNR